MKINVYGNEVIYLLYMLRSVVKGSLHRVVGPCSCNPYIRLVCISEQLSFLLKLFFTSQNSNRPQYNMRTGPELIEPLSLADHLSVVGSELVSNVFKSSDKLDFANYGAGVSDKKSSANIRVNIFLNLLYFAYIGLKTFLCGPRMEMSLNSRFIVG
jgi:hypothetical protein